MTPPEQKIREIFSQKGWSRLIEVLLKYRHRGQPLPSMVNLQNPTEEECLHHARLLRLPVKRGGVTLRYDLSRVSAALANGGLESDWHTILEILGGPIAEELLAARENKRAWQEFWPQMEAVQEWAPFDQWEEWLACLKRDGSLKRLSKGDCKQARVIVETAAKLLHALPFQGERSLAHVAADFCGGSHALDAAEPLSTLVLRGLALRLKQTFPTRSDSRREIWSAFGVVCDELSAPVLVFNLQFSSDTLLGRLTSLAAAENHPLHLTTRLIWSSEWNRIKCPPDVYVCENPTVLSMAANQFGQRCSPLVCVNGEPSTSARSLLRHLKSGGSRIHYHGDFDWPGIAIAKRVIEGLGAAPWCFDVDAYRAASRYQGRELNDKPVSSPWCPQLSVEMQRRGVAYDEEVMAGELLRAISKQP